MIDTYMRSYNGVGFHFRAGILETTSFNLYMNNFYDIYTVESKKRFHLLINLFSSFFVWRVVRGPIPRTCAWLSSLDRIEQLFGFQISKLVRQISSSIPRFQVGYVLEHPSEITLALYFYGEIFAFFEQSFVSCNNVLLRGWFGNMLEVFQNDLH
jgi:hypothetical protein